MVLVAVDGRWIASAIAAAYDNDVCRPARYDVDDADTMGTNLADGGAASDVLVPMV